MGSQIKGAFCAAIFSLSMFSTTDAALVSRLGGVAVYDTDLDITWLANANAGAGSAFDDGVSVLDGKMTWSSANNWAASLTVGGFSDWRLPATLMMDATCNTVSSSSGFNCTGSEMGHLFYNELSGTAPDSILDSGDPDLSLFNNIVAGDYWSATAFTNGTHAWNFSFGNGNQNLGLFEFELNALAVRSGDVSAVPIPAVVWLFGSGLVSGLTGLFSIARRKKA